MDGVRPVFRNLLVVAIVVYIVALTLMLSDMYSKVGHIEHTLAHITFGK